PRGHMYGREDAVARGSEIAHHDVPGLFAAQNVTAAAHVPGPMAVPDRRPHDVDAGRLQGQSEAQITHDGRHDHVAGQAPLRLRRHRQDRQNLVTVDNLPGRVDGQTAVRVPVEGKAGVGAVRHNSTLQIVEVRRAAMIVDVDAVWRV